MTVWYNKMQPFMAERLQNSRCNYSWLHWTIIIVICYVTNDSSDTLKCNHAWLKGYKTADATVSQSLTANQQTQKQAQIFQKLVKHAVRHQILSTSSSFAIWSWQFPMSPCTVCSHKLKLDKIYYLFILPSNTYHSLRASEMQEVRFWPENGKTTNSMSVEVQG